MEGRDTLDGEVQSRQHNTTGRGCTVGRVNGRWTAMRWRRAWVGRAMRAPLQTSRPSLWSNPRSGPQDTRHERSDPTESHGLRRRGVT